MKYLVTRYYAKQFDALRNKCCPTQMDFRLSLNRCKKWGPQGRKSNVFFAKSLDEIFIIKRVTRKKLESFVKFSSNISNICVTHYVLEAPHVWQRSLVFIRLDTHIIVYSTFDNYLLKTPREFTRLCFLHCVSACYIMCSSFRSL